MRGRRRGGTLLARYGLVPVPMFDAEQLARATSTIMVYLAGPLGEMHGPPPPPTTNSGYVVDPDADVAAAATVVATLTQRQQRHLSAVEEKDHLVSDDEVARETERQIAGASAAGQLVAWIGWETRRLVASDLFRDLTGTVAEQLLVHDVIGGQVVHDALAAKTPRSSKTTRAAPRGKEEP